VAGRAERPTVPDPRAPDRKPTARSLGWGLCRSLRPRRTVVFIVLAALRPQLTVAVVVVALTVLLIRRRWWPTVAAVLVVCLVSGAVLLPRAVADQQPVPGPRLSVLSANVDQGRASVPALAAVIRENRPDVVVLSEAAQRYRTLLSVALPELGYTSYVAAAPHAEDVNGITVLAAPRLGALDASMIDHGGFDPWLELTGGGLGRLRLVAVHASAPVPPKLVSWPRELEELQAWCAPGRGPALLAGDFNATLDHRLFRRGTANCTDAGDVTGHGLTATWNSRWPSWFGPQIDHILTAGGPRPTDLAIIDLPGTDHRALLAGIAL
jgi:endonuclease/exonuclease/phosphatase (EEP) superfamily protein YafD